MAELATDPTGYEFEDYVAAQFAARRCFVEVGVTERDPQDILELDVVWTQYGDPQPAPMPVEVKSGKWGLSDIFKFYGWLQYLGLSGGQLIATTTPDRLDPEALERLCKRIGVQVVGISDISRADDVFDGMGLPALTSIASLARWRYSFSIQRRLLRSLQTSLRNGYCCESCSAAKDYHRLLNDAVFFEPDVRQRVYKLMEAHSHHRRLALTIANQVAGGAADFDAPQTCPEFRQALYGGRHFPIQASLYLQHRARLYILKAAVDYWLQREAGVLPTQIVSILGFQVDLADSMLYQAFIASVDALSTLSCFRLLPRFWQTFLFGFGGFILTNRMEQEYEALSIETGVPMDQIDSALTAFDSFFPLEGGWLAQPDQDDRRTVKLMPAAVRGLGAFYRLLLEETEDYADLGVNGTTVRRLMSDHCTGARVLDCCERDLHAA